MKKVLSIITLLVLVTLLYTGCDILFGGGSGNTFTLTPKNLLFIEESDQTTGPKTEVFMAFGKPADLGAASFTLQYSDNSGTSWNDFVLYGDTLTTETDTTDNFNIPIGSHYMLRLRITGGQYDGQTSNEVDVPISSVATWFHWWSLNYSMTSTHSPRAGFGMLANFIVKTVDTNTVVSNTGLSYQWYRVDPDDFEVMTPIAGETTLGYTTTNADKGYMIMLRATGEESTIGGYIQLMPEFIVE